MTYLFVGAGQAGSAIVDAVFDNTSESTLGVFGEDDISALAEPLVFNSTIRDLQNLRNVDADAQFGIAETHGLVEANTSGFEEQVTGGFGRDPVKADEVMTDHYRELVNMLEDRYGASTGALTDGGEAAWSEEDDEWSSEDDDFEDDGFGDDEFDAGDGGTASPTEQDEIQFAFVCLGLGGGTGCGIAPSIVDAIHEYTNDRADVVAIAVLPNTMGQVSEGDGEAGAGRQAWNARYGLNRLEDRAEGIVLVDNQRISYQAAAESQFAEYNEYVAAGIYDLVAGPILSGVDPSDYDQIDTPDIDVQDIVTSLSFGVGTSASKTGYAALGRSATMTQSLAGYILPLVGSKNVDSAALVRLATSKQSIADLDPSDAQKAIGLVRAPSSYLSGGGKGVETSTIREYLQAQCSLQEVNLGVALNDRRLATVTTLMTYKREDLDRIAEIEEKAELYEAQTEAMLQ